MNSEWLNWTQNNLARGCSPRDIYDILRRHNYSDKDIACAMGNAFPEERQTLLVESDIDYGMLARPRLVQQARELGAQALDDGRLQLFVLLDFLDSKTCGAICALMDSQLCPSTVTTGDLHYGFRTSSTCELGLMPSPLVAEVDQKIANTLGINPSWAEPMQGQKYDIGQEFKAHVDYFKPRTNEYEKYAGKRGQRSWTFMIYLNTTTAGGATHFTHIDRKFLPQQGTAVIWNNLLPNGMPNIMTEHHGTPVIKGYKSIITKWFRDRGPGGPLTAC